MWTAYAHPDRQIPTQNQIANDLFEHCEGVYWGWAISYNAAACGVNRVVFDNSSCISCEDPIQARELDPSLATKAAAYNVDQYNEPTMVAINQHQHAVLFVGGYYGPDGITGNLVAYHTNYHDPIAGVRQQGVGDWLTTIAQPTGSAYQIGHYYDQGVQRLSEIFDYFGGTYYGDPAPPECDPSIRGDCGPEQMVNGLLPRALGGVTATLAGLLRNPDGLARTTTNALMARGLAGRATASPSLGQALRGAVHRHWIRKPVGPGRANHGMRQSIYVPHPYSKERADIIDNCLTGLTQAKVDLDPGLAPLVHDPSITVSDVRHVKSLIGNEDYSLLTFEDQTGRPYAVASVSDTGWFKEAARLSDGQSVPGDSEILGRAAEYGFSVVDGPSWLLMTSSAIGCAGSLTPVAAMRTRGGHWLLMDMRRRLYVEDAQGPITVWTKVGGRVTLREVTGQ